MNNPYFLPFSFNGTGRLLYTVLDNGQRVVLVPFAQVLVWWTKAVCFKMFDFDLELFRTWFGI